jgi:hypothetical protein
MYLIPIKILFSNFNLLKRKLRNFSTFPLASPNQIGPLALAARQFSFTFHNFILGEADLTSGPFGLSQPAWSVKSLSSSSNACRHRRLSLAIAALW